MQRSTMFALVSSFSIGLLIGASLTLQSGFLSCSENVARRVTSTEQVVAQPRRSFVTLTEQVATTATASPSISARYSQSNHSWPRPPPEEQLEKTTDRKYVVDVVIRSYVGDIHWLIFCLRSLEAYGQIFRAVMVIYPDYEEAFFKSILNDYRVSKTGFRLNLVLLPEREVIPSGYVQQMYSKMIADQFSDADYFLYLDSDTILTREASWDDLFVGGKVKVLFKNWTEMSNPRHVEFWKASTHAALDLKSEETFMVSGAPLYPRDVFIAVRNRVQQTHNESMADYLMTRHCAKIQLPSEYEMAGLYARFFSSHSTTFFHLNNISVYKLPQLSL